MIGTNPGQVDPALTMPTKRQRKFRFTITGILVATGVFAALFLAAFQEDTGTVPTIRNVSKSSERTLDRERKLDAFHATLLANGFRKVRTPGWTEEDGDWFYNASERGVWVNTEVIGHQRITRSFGRRWSRPLGYDPSKSGPRTRASGESLLTKVSRWHHQP